MVLAIEADGASYRKSGSVRDRDRLRGEHLQRLGWSYHRLWSTNWFHDPDAEVAKLRQAYDRAVASAPRSQPPEPPEPYEPPQPYEPPEPIEPPGPDEPPGPIEPPIITGAEMEVREPHPAAEPSRAVATRPSATPATRLPRRGWPLPWTG